MEKDYQIFLHQLLATDEQEWGYFVSGSLAELPLHYIALFFTDMDMMYCARNRCAISTDDFIPEAFKGTFYFIENIPDCHGYVKLRSGCKYLKREDFCEKDWPTEGPSFEELLSINHRRTKNKYNQPIMMFDFVQCIVSPQWPLQAKEWPIRKRTNNWPSKEIIARVMDNGCHLVRKSHPNCSGDNEMFRFSFSKAEIILIKTWNSNQIYIYHLIRQVKRHLEKTWKSENHKSAICTYFFKTLMLWACEEKCPEFWNDCSIESSLQELLFEMIEWLIEKRCPNYFIPEYNMLDHLQSPDFDFEKEIRDILEISNDFGFLLMKTPNWYQNINLSFPLPNKLLVLMQLAHSHSIGYLHTSNREWLRRPSVSHSCTYSPLVREEFRNLYLGISEHYRFVTKFHHDVSLSKASRYLNRAVMDDRRCSTMEFNLGDTAADFFESNFVVSDPDLHKDGILSNCKNETINQRNIVRSEGASDSVSWRHKGDVNPEHTIFMQEAVCTWRSDPEKELNLYDMLRPSFAVSASYLANFHYSTRKDYDLAIRICEEASSMLANDFFGNSDPNSTEGIPRALILNNKLVVLFDEEIQTVFGFVVLVKELNLDGCRGMPSEAHMSELSGRQLSCNKTVSQIGSRIFFGLHALEFLNYVHYRCKLQKYVSEAEQIPEKIYEMPTRPDFSFDSSSVILSAAARISIQ